LNHVTGTVKGAGRVYQRGEFLAERDAALKAWAAHVLAQGEGAAVTENVVAIRRSRARGPAR
jgi:hypothetical protein